MNVCIQVIGITGYIDMADVAVAAAHLYIVSGLEYVGMIIIVVFHMKVASGSVFEKLFRPFASL